MSYPIWQIDAFTDRRLAGNPAAVVVLPEWPGEDLLQAIAAENNLSETAFLVREEPGWRIRWFTPAMEVNLCGHATLASGFVVLNHLEPSLESVTFASRSGPLTASRQGRRFALDLPAYPCQSIDTPPLLVEALGATPAETWLGVKMMAVFEREDQVAALVPDFAKVARIEAFGVIATAPGTQCDFVSRYFVPQAGVNEDPVTGAAHCQLTPYWARRLGTRTLHARQISKRGGELWCEDRGERVTLAGEAVSYLIGSIEI